MKRCKVCGTQLNPDDLFCQECGEPCCTLEEFENSITYSKEHRHKHGQKANTADINMLGLILLIGCIILWFTAPFVAVNRLTLGDQPSALQIVFDDVVHVGDLSQTAAFWSSIISILGIIFCLIYIISGQNKQAYFIAILTEIPLAVVMFDVLSWMDNMEMVFKKLGFGYWGICILLLTVIYSCRQQS